MSREITEAALQPFENAYDLLSRYIEVCPEEIWKETNGGWPVWQQVCHTISALHFFTGIPAEGLPCAPDESRLSRVSTAPAPGREIMKALAEKARAAVSAYAAGLDDSALARPNEQISSVLGRQVSHVAILGMLASHTLYHVGSCDAALRDHGLPGVF